MPPRICGPTPDGDDDAYARHKARSRARQAGISAAGREIEIPEIVDPDRRESCRLNLRLYLETYHRASFPLAWSDDHLHLIETLQDTIINGNLHAFAMPRGSGKTTIARHAAQWAIQYGHKRFVVLVGANNEFSTQLLDQILIDYESNPLLFDDFPEICAPLRALEGIRNRAKGQLAGGEPTAMMFKTRLWRLPTVAGSLSSGAIIKCGSPKSAVRGANMLLPDGTTLRPDFVLIDDPQTRATAESPKAVERLVQIIQGDILGCAGPGQAIAAAMPCTVIRPGDAADTLLNQELHPEWRGTRAKLLYAFPTRIDLWEEYWEIFSRELRSGCRDAVPAAALEFYRTHRPDMDDGAKPAWQARKRPEELSAIQHAMTLYLRDPEAFLAEYQNEPTNPHSDIPQLTVDLWRSRITDRPRAIVPAAADLVICTIDVHKRVLVWSSTAWDQRFTGAITDYGTHPDQAVSLWRVQTARPTLLDLCEPGAGDSAALRRGLLTLIDRLATRSWRREDGAQLSTGLIVIDTGYEQEVVFSAINESPHWALCLGFKGAAKKANDCPISRYNRRPGWVIGTEWFTKITPGIGKQLIADVNYWKSFVAARAASSPGDPGSLTIFGREADGTKSEHTLLLTHLSAEYSQEERGERTVQVWSPKPGVENHYFDTVDMGAIGASVRGISLGTSLRPAATKATSLAELKAAAKARG